MKPSVPPDSTVAASVPAWATMPQVRSSAGDIAFGPATAVPGAAPWTGGGGSCGWA